MTIIARHSYSAGASDPKARALQEALAENERLRAQNGWLYDALCGCADVLEGHPIYSDELRAQVKQALKEMDDA